MVLFLPFLLVGPLLVLAEAVLALWAHGPLGWLGSIALLGGVYGSTRLALRRALRWWRSTKAPVRRVVP